MRLLILPIYSCSSFLARRYIVRAAVIYLSKLLVFLNLPYSCGIECLGERGPRSGNAPVRTAFHVLRLRRGLRYYGFLTLVSSVRAIEWIRALTARFIFDCHVSF